MTLDTLIEILEKIKASSIPSHVIVHINREEGVYYERITSVSNEHGGYVVINVE